MGNAIVYRNIQNEIKYTNFQSESGRYFIKAPYWPTHKGQLFKSPTEFFEAFNHSGMTLAGWPKPL